MMRTTRPMTKLTTLDGNCRIRWRDPHRRRTVYVRVYDRQIITIQPELKRWLDRPFKEFCQWMRKRYPKTFQREEWSEQLVPPTGSEEYEYDEPMEHEPVIQQVVVVWPGIKTIVWTVDKSDPLRLSQAVARQCAEIRRGWPDDVERQRQTGMSVLQPYETPGAEDVPWIQRGHHDFDGYDEDESPLAVDVFEDTE